MSGEDDDVEEISATPEELEEAIRLVEQAVADLPEPSTLRHMLAGVGAAVVLANLYAVVGRPGAAEHWREGANLGLGLGLRGLLANARDNLRERRPVGDA